MTDQPFTDSDEKKVRRAQQSVNQAEEKAEKAKQNADDLARKKGDPSSASTAELITGEY